MKKMPPGEASRGTAGVSEKDRASDLLGTPNKAEVFVEARRKVYNRILKIGLKVIISVRLVSNKEA